ncbi:uncharacterized protein FIBRA_08200 [Fibroporia radiculosa]|uniref:Peptidase C14 caspase domain-containing protein n=1 Tax=Fibroporia radiculosa TaxID=599839 RepID=J4IC83_9APHY|nr:uncharacterized protein FIBRA_08200 [Fibroporia radiculosa]CCM05961.1 predicted protein [Fibroporia radiculosa]
MPNQRLHSEQKSDSPTQGKNDSPETPSPILYPRLFALIIGINNYKSASIANLLGAVPDADAVRDYLLGQVGIPISQIRILRDSEATRSAILHGISAFLDDERIKKGDPILIYYAGHGSKSSAPSGWEARGGEIQLLVPYDQSSLDAGGKVHGIPDRTLGALLTRLAGEKGDNISVILDCCHSGSGTRADDGESTYMVRSVEIEAIPFDLDKDVWSLQSLSYEDRATAIATGFAHSGLRSHVLLSACGAEERALERDGRGLFTKALIDALLEHGTDKLTYADVVQRIANLPTQHPQCEGVNQNRIHFNAIATGQRHILHKIRKHGDIYIMSAGTAQGVTKGARFAVYKEKYPSVQGKPLGTVIASSPGNAETKMDAFPPGSDFPLDMEGFALQTRTGAEESLRIHIAVDSEFASEFEARSKEMQESDPAWRTIIRTEKEKAELGIALEKGRIVFNILDRYTTQHGLTRMPFPVARTVDAVLPVVRSAAHFYWHLRRKPGSEARSGMRKFVDIEFTQLKGSEEKFDGHLHPVLHKYGPNLNCNNKIDLQIKDTARYGLKIVNKSEVALYPALFYFDSSNLSIEPYYEPPTAKGIVDAPLRKQSSLTIGYGDSGSIPREYFLRDGQKLDVGFLKLFLSTEYVDWSHISQPSPFDNTRASKQAPVNYPMIWDTIVVPIIQRGTS